MNLNELTVKEIVDVLPVFQPQGKRVTIENRKSYALSFCKSGKITYTHNGKSYQSETDSVIFHPQGESYLLSCTEGGEFPLIEFYLQDKRIDCFMQFEISSSATFLDLFDKLRENFGIESMRAKNFSILYEIFHLLEDGQHGKENGILAPAMDYLCKNFSDSELTVSHLSQISHVSECYFRRIFKEKYGMAPKEYITSLRINKAKQLLKEGNLSVSEIASKCGFSNVFYFSRAFKSQTHSAPGEYMKLNIKRTI